MSPEMNDNIIIPVAPSDGEAGAGNTNAITKFLRTLSLQLLTVIVMVREHELGKLVFNLGAAATVGLIITSGGKPETTWPGHLVVMGLSSGCGLIFAGILLREAFRPKAGEVMEHTGIALVMTSFYGLVASALPPELGWVSMLSASFCVFTLLIPVLPHGS